MPSKGPFEVNRLIALLVSLTLFGCVSNLPKQELVCNLIRKQELTIKKYCHIFNLSPRVYASVVYGELFNNLDVYDDFDEVRARIGFDPSIGFSQIRLSTSVWLEDNYCLNGFIKKSKTKKELIDKLVNDDSNIMYSVLYVSVIESTIKKKHIPLNVCTIASYYGRGIDYEKEIYDFSYSNRIGTTAQEFYDSVKLKESFPRSNDNRTSETTVESER